MNIFIEKNSLRKLYLLSTLYSENRFFSMKELEQKLGYNNKTIMKMVQTLKLEEVAWQEDMSLIVDSDRKVFLQKKSRFSLETVKLYYLKESYMFKICDAIFNEEFIDIMTFSNTNFISYSTSYARLNEIKPLLQHYSLKFKPNNMSSFEGEEKQIRYFFFHFYWSTYWGTEWPFKKIEKQAFDMIIYLIKKIRKTTTLYISEEEEICFWLGVIATRVKLGYSIESVDLYDCIIKDNAVFDDFKDRLSEEFRSIFPMLTENELVNELKFFYVVLYSNDYFEIDDSQISETLVFSQNRNGEIFEATNYCLKTCIDVFNLSLSAAEYGVIYANLIHLHAEVYFFEGDISNFFNDFLETDGLESGAEDIVDVLLNDFCEELVKKNEYEHIFKNKKRLIASYKRIICEHIPIFGHEKFVKIHLISMHGSKYLPHLKNLIRYSNNEEIEFSTDYKDADLIISDRLYERISDIKTPLVIWGEKPTDNELTEVNQIIKKVSFERQQEHFKMLKHLPVN